MITKTEAIDLILLNVLGGKLSDDANVQRGEVDAYMDIAYGLAIKNVVVEQQLSEKTLSQLGAAFNHVMVPYTGTPTKDEARSLWRLDLPAILPAAGNDGVGMVYPEKNPSMPYVRMDNAISFAGSPQLLSIMPSFHVEGSIVWLHAYSMPVHPLIAMICPSVSLMDPEEEIKYPDAVTGNALKIAVEWFRGQRETLADPISNDKDLNERT